MDVPPRLDKRRVRMHFERAAPTYDSFAVLQREVAARLLERLDLVKLEPRVVLDTGSGTGQMARALTGRYPQAYVLALDLSLAMLGRVRQPRSLWSRVARRDRAPLPVCADLERLPVRDASVDMVCSNLALEWTERPEQALAEMRRVLTRGGLLMFTTLGPDTLKELRAAHPDAAAGVHVFTDMHDIGDLLVRTGYVDPVMDMEHITLTFADLAGLARELRSTGCSSASVAQRAGLRGRSWWRYLEEAYERFRRDEGLPATFEIVYGHAWKPEAPRVTDDGRAVIRIEPRPGG